MRYKADMRLIITVEFDDTGEDSLVDQAFDALHDITFDQNEHDAELIGRPEPTR